MMDPSHRTTWGLAAVRSFAGPALAVFLLAWLGGHASSTSWAIQDASLKWKTIETEHFRLSYHNGLEDLAQRAAAAAEEARRRLIIFLGYEPKWKVELLLTDQFDDANALTMVVPRNTIVLYATSPPDMSTLEDYDDWMLALMVHEYTHVLHLDNWGGISRVLNIIFGKQFIPNAVQPLWILEGLAVYDESTRTGGGRLNSTTWDMYMRMAALENRLLPIDKLSSGSIDWPHGTSYYLYGSFFLQWVKQRYGEKVFSLYSEDYGNDLVPFGINRDIKKITGKTWVQLYRQWRSETKDKYYKQKNDVAKAGIREGIQITFTGETDRSPRFSPDGKKIGFYSYDGHDRSAIYTLDLHGPRKALKDLEEKGKIVTDCCKGKWKEKKILEITGQASLAFTPDGQGLFYSRSETWKNWYQYHDLYYLDLGDPKHPERLTHGKRARQPDVSGDGKKIVYTKNKAGSSFLFLAQDAVHPDEGKVIDSLPPLSQSFSPRFSPDGQKVAYSAWLPGGKRDIRVVDLKGDGTLPVTSDRYVDTGPAWDPSGRYLYFCSDRTGISNIYAYDFEDGSLWQVTNVVGGAFMPDVSPDGREIVYVGYRSRGYDLFLVPVDKKSWVRADGSLPNLVPDRPEADTSWATLEKDLKPKRYNPLRTLIPKTWMFRIAEDGFGQSITLFTAASDIAGQHYLGASLHIGLTGKFRIGYNLDYSFLKLPVDISFSHSRYVGLQGGLWIDDQNRLWPEIGYRTALTLSYPIAFNDFRNSFYARYRLTYMTSEEEMESPVDPNAALPVLPDTGFLSGFELGWSFSNIHGSTFGISAEQGGALWASVGFDLPPLGSDYTQISVSYGATGYWELPFLKHHVLAGRFAGGYGSSTFSRRGVFVVGGFPEEDILMDIINMVRMYSVALRGYPPVAAWGDQYYLLNVEYRIPVLDIFRGILTFPAALNRIYVTIFSDTGGAWWAGRFDREGIKTGLGGELFISITYAYYLELTFRIGYAYGFMDPGGHQTYVVLSAPF